MEMADRNGPCEGSIELAFYATRLAPTCTHSRPFARYVTTLTRKCVCVCDYVCVCVCVCLAGKQYEEEEYDVCVLTSKALSVCSIESHTNPTPHVRENFDCAWGCGGKRP